MIELSNSIIYLFAGIGSLISSSVLYARLGFFLTCLFISKPIVLSSFLMLLAVYLVGSTPFLPLFLEKNLGTSTS